jgi:hypothetical protein
MSRLHVLDLPADRMEGEAVAALFFEDDRPLHGPAALIDWRLNGLLTNLLLGGEAVGRPGERVLALGNGKLAATWALLVGGGRWRGLDRVGYRERIGNLLESCRQARFGRVAICLSPLDGMEEGEMNGLVAGVLEAGSGLECLFSVTSRNQRRLYPASF